MVKDRTARLKVRARGVGPLNKIVKNLTPNFSVLTSTWFVPTTKVEKIRYYRSTWHKLGTLRQFSYPAPPPLRTGQLLIALRADQVNGTHVKSPAPLKKLHSPPGSPLQVQLRRAVHHEPLNLFQMHLKTLTQSPHQGPQRGNRKAESAGDFADQERQEATSRSWCACWVFCPAPTRITFLPAKHLPQGPSREAGHAGTLVLKARTNSQVPNHGHFPGGPALRPPRRPCGPAHLRGIHRVAPTKEGAPEPRGCSRRPPPEPGRRKERREDAQHSHPAAACAHCA